MRLLQRKGLTLSEITGRCKSPVTRQHVVDLLYTSVVAR